MPGRIYPRSPREEMLGWVHLPRLIDKVRLHLAGKLLTDYQENFLHKGFDKLWFSNAEVSPEVFVEVVRSSITDGEVCDWVRENVKVSPESKAKFRDQVCNAGQQNEEARERLRWRKEQSGLLNRDDINYFVDLIDADEGR